MDRKTLEALAAALVERTIDTCRFSIETIGLDPLDIERVLLVGGSTRMPLVVRRVEEYFQKKASAKINPDEVVAQGAAVQAAALTKGAATAAVKAPHTRRAAERQATSPQASDASPADQPAPAPARKRITIPGPGASSDPTTPDPAFQVPPVASLGKVNLVKQVVPRRAGPPPQAPAPQALAPQALAPQALAPQALAPQAPAPPGRGLFAAPLADDDVTKQIDSALLEFMLEGTAEAKGGAPAVPPPPEAPAAPDPPSFEFELEIEQPSSTPVTPRFVDLPPPEPEGPMVPARRRPPPPPPPRVAGRPPAPAARSVTPAPEEEISFADPDVLMAAALPAPDEDDLPPPSPPPPRVTPLLIDVTPISLGVEVAGGFCDFLIRANTPVPCDRTRVFRTASDHQVAVRVRVVQGESEKFGDNTYLGDLELTGLRAAARGDVEVAVTFEIDADGILNVRAKEEATGRETVARMNLLGAQTDADEVAAMMARQRKHEVA
jgi:molecular chaperone DnaK